MSKITKVVVWQVLKIIYSIMLLKRSLRISIKHGLDLKKKEKCSVNHIVQKFKVLAEGCHAWIALGLGQLDHWSVVWDSSR